VNPASAILPRSATPPQEKVTEKVTPLPLLLSPAEAARQLSLSRRTVYHLIESKQLRAVNYGRRRLIPREGLERFVRELEAASLEEEK
jgi:excisionase family DNA binding protein